MATYAAQIDCMDQGIGRIVATLDKNKLTQNTMIVFMSDNGGCAEYKSTMDPSIDKLGSDESFESYRGNWANLSNTPFRLYKTRVHEGGIHTPFIVSWPGHTAKIGSVIDNDPAHIIDLMPTFLAAAGAKYPKSYNGNKINPFNGQSLISVFKGEKIPERAIYWEHQANRAIRYQDWKLVSKSTEKVPYIGEWELYNLKNDKTELTDLAKKYPGKVKELENMWTNWANANNVFPLNGTDLGSRRKQFERNL
jgi:arylsulfatase